MESFSIRLAGDAIAVLAEVPGDPKGQRVLATKYLDDRFDASPAIAGDELFLRGHHYLYCLAEGRSGAPEAPAEEDAPLKTSRSP